MKKIFFINFIIIVSTFLLFEFFLRIFDIIELQGFEKNTFFSEDGITYHNPNILKIGMGKKIKTDSNGFRIPLENFKYDEELENILILGDSVSFGVSVEEKKTFIGLLRKKINKNFYNTSVAGHRLDNYTILLEKYHQQFPKIKDVIVFLCINDIVTEDGVVKKDNLSFKSNNNKLIEKIKKNDFLINVNFFLREKSTVFNLAKAIGTQNVKRHFYYEVPFYENEDYLNNYKNNLKKIIDFSNLNKLNVKFVLLPYKHQIDNFCETKLMMPQNKINNIFKKINYELFDFSDEFCDKDNSSKLFLNFDPMHLSAKGHKFVSELLIKNGVVN